jgi:UDP-N-acetylmuramate dehydrogenase
MIVIEENISLRSFNTFGVPAKSRIFAEASNTNDLQSVVAIFRNHSLPRLILGGGSNILFTKDFEGIVIHPNIQGSEIIRQDEHHVWVKACAGENWDQFVSLCVTNNWGGLENLSLIPGTIGACPIQNIGAYGVEVKETIDTVEALDIETGTIKHFNTDACEFGYRDSVFKHAAKNLYIILSVTFKLSKSPVVKTAYREVQEALTGISAITVRTVRNVIIDIRKRKLPDPARFGNAGSFFKNPLISNRLLDEILAKHPGISSFEVGEGLHKISAASLIEHSGWKGQREGDVGTYENQPLVIVNYGDAKGIDIYNYAKKIQQSVSDTFGVCLEMEVNIY